MRLPIVEYPNIVTASLKHFGPAFRTAAQRQHFCQYVTGLMAGDKGTVQAGPCHKRCPLFGKRNILNSIPKK